MAKACIVSKPMSMNALFVVAGSAGGAMIYPQNAPVGAAVGGLLVLFVLKAM